MDETNSLIEQRRAKLAALRAKGIDPFKSKFSPTEKCAEARANYSEGREVCVAGRVTAHRDMARACSSMSAIKAGAYRSTRKRMFGDERSIFSATWIWVTLSA
jgi:lysyl-tRNA synthetase class II